VRTSAASSRIYRNTIAEGEAEDGEQETMVYVVDRDIWEREKLRTRLRPAFLITQKNKVQMNVIGRLLAAMAGAKINILSHRPA
jgi:hypothetical protein